jgi:hypothetical protein
VRTLALVTACLAAACGPLGAGAPEAHPTATVRFTPEPAATPTPRPTPPACPAGSFVVGEGSEAIVRVREQVGFIPAPFDAVMTTKAIAGSFRLDSNGAFEACSRIEVDVRTVRSADTALHPEILNRDRAIEELLGSRRFPSAVLVPLLTVGLPSPLPERGEWTFTLTGKLTIREIERPSTWSVVARRDGATITATATTEFGFEEYSIERPSQVLSLQDKIRLEIKLVARQP